MKTTVCLGQPSWSFASDKVEASVTRAGGHLGPVRFRLPGGFVAPFSVAPWAEEKISADAPNLLRSLRGDFFCAPFGGNGTPHQGEKHPPHGESANAAWRFESLEKNGDGTKLHLSLATKARPGRIDKVVGLRKGETALYCRHTLSGMKGAMALGHHVMLKCPAGEGSGRVSTSRILYAQVAPTPFEDPAQGGYSSLKPGALFSRLDRVPKSDGAKADLSVFPARRGFEDLVMIVHEARPDFAWTAVAFPEQGYVWFSLKDPRALRSTVFWISNGGRHYAPWNGRHVDVLGLEDVTSYFHYGLAESARANPVSQRGYPTSVTLNPKSPLPVSYIMAVAAIPRGFDRVKSIVPERGSVRLLSTSGLSVTAPLDVSFLYETLFPI
jgi:hypothetical protein